MDKAASKLILGAYPADRQDLSDPLLAEALREVERDPELAAWFAEEKRFDAAMTDALEDVPAPAGLKDLLLLNARSPRPRNVVALPPAWRRQATAWLALAAALVAAFFLGRATLPQSAPKPQVASGNDPAGANALALQAIAYTGKMPALQFVCFDAAVVADWVKDKASGMKMGQVLDKPLTSMQMIGSSATHWEGKPVVMIALQNGHQMAMLYLVRAADFPDAVEHTGEITEKDGWVSKTGRHGEQIYVLTTKGSRKDLDFPMPL